MKKTSILIMLLATALVARAFDFSKQAPSGQTLYFNVTTASTVTVVAPADEWEGFAKPQGRLQLPSSVENDGVTYQVTAVDRDAFRDCEGITALEVPGSVTSIGVTAFRGCTAMTALRLHEGVAMLGRMAFAFCEALDTIELPATLREIGISAFHNSAYVTNMDNWTDSVLYIGPFVIQANSLVVGPVEVVEGTLGLGTGAFYYCHNMRQAVLPSTLLFIGNLAFADCEALDTIRVRATVPPALDADAFNVEPRPVAVVPCGTLAAYGAAPVWGTLSLVEDSCGGQQGIVDATESCPVVVATRGGVEVRGAHDSAVAVHDIMGRRVFYTQKAADTLFVALPEMGIYIVTVDGMHPYKVLAGSK